jgi:hypothetical protein
MRSGFSVEGEKETYLHRIAFTMLADAPLRPAESRDLIRYTAETHWSGGRQP